MPSIPVSELSAKAYRCRKITSRIIIKEESAFFSWRSLKSTKDVSIASNICIWVLFHIPIRDHKTMVYSLRGLVITQQPDTFFQYLYSYASTSSARVASERIETKSYLTSPKKLFLSAEQVVKKTQLKSEPYLWAPKIFLWISFSQPSIKNFLYEPRCKLKLIKGNYWYFSKTKNKTVWISNNWLKKKKNFFSIQINQLKMNDDRMKSMKK